MNNIASTVGFHKERFSLYVKYRLTYDIMRNDNMWGLFRTTENFNKIKLNIKQTKGVN